MLTGEAGKMRHNWAIIQSIVFFYCTAEQQALGSKWRKTERARTRETREASDTSQKHIFIKTKRVTVAFYGKYKCLHTCLHDQNNQGSFAWW